MNGTREGIHRKRVFRKPLSALSRIGVKSKLSARRKNYRISELSVPQPPEPDSHHAAEYEFPHVRSLLLCGATASLRERGAMADTQLSNQVCSLTVVYAEEPRSIANANREKFGGEFAFAIVVLPPCLKSEARQRMSRPFPSVSPPPGGLGTTER